MQLGDRQALVNQSLGRLPEPAAAFPLLRFLSLTASNLLAHLHQPSTTPTTTTSSNADTVKVPRTASFRTDFSGEERAAQQGSEGSVAVIERLIADHDHVLYCTRACSLSLTLLHTRKNKLENNQSRQLLSQAVP